MKAVRANVAGSSKAYTFTTGPLSAAMVPDNTTEPCSGESTLMDVDSPAATVSTSLRTVHGATCGRISIVAVCPTDAGVVVKSSTF